MEWMHGTSFARFCVFVGWGVGGGGGERGRAPPPNDMI